MGAARHASPFYFLTNLKLTMFKYEDTSLIREQEGLGLTILGIHFYREDRAIVIEVWNRKITYYFGFDPQRTDN